MIVLVTKLSDISNRFTVSWMQNQTSTIGIITLTIPISLARTVVMFQPYLLGENIARNNTFGMGQDNITDVHYYSYGEFVQFLIVGYTNP